MSNTFNLGDGKWATKEGSTLAYNDENGNFKPLPFTFDRASSATRVNKNGLIKTVGLDQPRVDYLNDSNGALLLEPSRTNLVEYSEDGTQWDTVNSAVSLTTDSTSPSGQSSVYKVNDDATDAQHRVDVRPSVTSGTEYAFSAFVKKPSGSDIDFAYLLFSSNFSTTRFYFNIEEGTSLDSGGTIEDYGNGWYRLSANATANSSGNGILGVNLSNANNNNTYSGTGNGSMFVWGIQVELNASYPTSYIPTQGSAVTRLEEDIALTLPDNASFNSSVGFTLYGEFLTNGGSGSSSMALQFNGNTGYFGFGHNSSTWRARIRTGTDNELHSSSVSIFSVGKLALSFSSSGFSMYANGTSFASGNTNMGAITSSDSVVFRDTDEFGSFRIRNLKLYNTRLSNEELQALTT